MKKKLLFLSIVLFFTLTSNGIAGPTTFGFEAIVEEGDTSSNLDDHAIGERQFSMEVELIADDKALFRFINTGPDSSTITQIYFDDDPIGSQSTYDDPNSPNSWLDVNNAELTVEGNVDFAQFIPNGSNVPNLPGGQDPAVDFYADTGFAFNADNPSPDWGINPGESLTIKLAVNTQDIINKLTAGSIRIGLHVQAFASGESESFINTPGGIPGVDPVPEPGTMVLFGFSLIALAGMGRKRLKS